MSRVVISMGSNLGQRERNLRLAVRTLEEDPQMEVLAVSPIYRSAPMGPALHEFLNGAILVETELDPEVLLHRLKRCETLAGRPEEHGRWGPRELDLDIILAGDLVRSGGDPLVPHPGLMERDFVLVPVLDLMPDARHPVTGESLAEALDALEDRTLLGEPQPLPSSLDHEVLEHTADVGFCVRASSRFELLEDCAMVLAHAMVPRSGRREERVVEASLKAPDDETLLVDLLSELVYQVDTQAFVPVRVSVTARSDQVETGIRARLHGSAVEPGQVRMAVKAVTHHRIRFGRDGPGRWAARYYLDL